MRFFIMTQLLLFILLMLSILFMRFIKKKEKWHKKYWTFNSLYEIRSRCSDTRVTSFKLSILFMRFDAIRSMPDKTDADRFQFSLWDSLFEYVMEELQFFKPFQFSLWDSEILRATTLFEYIVFQFSLWDSQSIHDITSFFVFYFQFSLWDSLSRFFIAKSLPIAFNSLYEILNVIRMSFYVSFNFQFSLWDSDECKYYLDLLYLLFQFSLWDSLFGQETTRFFYDIAFNSLYEILKYLSRNGISPITFNSLYEIRQWITAFSPKRQLSILFMRFPRSWRGFVTPSTILSILFMRFFTGLLVRRLR